ncbi:hypothetical protein J6590_035271 [Homalodisca vitripennis]|nr:hypothetical protein J6590_035271 [Homalodisca vitripennis]
MAVMSMTVLGLLTVWGLTQRKCFCAVRSQSPEVFRRHGSPFLSSTVVLVVSDTIGTGAGRRHWAMGLKPTHSFSFRDVQHGSFAVYSIVKFLF